MRNKRVDLELLDSDLSECLASLEDGEELDAAHCADLMRRIEEIVPVVGADEALALKETLDRLISVVATSLESIEAELKQLQQGKKGLKGYSHIRSFGTRQRLCRTA